METFMKLDLVLPKRITKLCAATRQAQQLQWHTKQSSGNLNIKGYGKDAVHLEFTGCNFFEVKENVISCVIESITKKRHEKDKDQQDKKVKRRTKVLTKGQPLPECQETKVKVEVPSDVLPDYKGDIEKEEIAGLAQEGADGMPSTWRRSSRRIKPNVKEEFHYESLKDMKPKKRFHHSAADLDSEEDLNPQEDKEETVGEKLTVNIPSKKATCKICQLNVANLRIHMLSKHVTVCPHCEMEIKKKDYKEHLKTAHPGSVLTELCPICMKPFRSLKKHITAKHSGRLHHDHICNQCGYATYDRHALRNHIMHVHHNVRMFKCETCCQTFKTKQVLKQHTRIVHEGARDFQCRVCMKKFTKKYHLDVHTRTHMGEKPYLCSYCPRQFTDKANLDVHMETVHLKVFSYQCKSCDQLFRRKKLLVEHIRGNHANAEKLLLQGVGKLTQPKSKPVNPQSQVMDGRKYAFNPQDFQLEVGEEVNKQVLQAGISGKKQNLTASSFKLEVAEAMLNINPVENQPNRYLVHLPGGKRLVLSSTGTTVQRVQQQQQQQQHFTKQHQQVNVDVSTGSSKIAVEEPQDVVQETPDAVVETSGAQLDSQSHHTRQEISILELVQQVVQSTGGWATGDSETPAEGITVEVPYSSDTQHIESTQKSQQFQCVSIENSNSEETQIVENAQVNIGDTDHLHLCLNDEVPQETGLQQQICLDGQEPDHEEVTPNIGVQDIIQEHPLQNHPGVKAGTNLAYADSVTAENQQQTTSEVMSVSSAPLVEDFNEHGDSVIVVPEENGQEITLSAQGYTFVTNNPEEQ